MRFLARYICRNAPGEYHRTVYADGVNEATQRAQRYTKKGYMLLSVMQVV